MRRPARAVGLSLSLTLSSAGAWQLGCADQEAAPRAATGEAASAERTAASDSSSAAIDRLSNAALDERIDRDGAHSAWAAVRERSRLLARRGARGAIHGRVGPPIGAGWGWLVDDTEGQGALAVRVQWVPEAVGRVSEGQRVLVSGAWSVAPDGGWFWRAADTAVASDAPAIEFPFEPGLTVGEIESSELPATTRGPEPGPAGPVVLTIVDTPVRFGDGWAVAAGAGAAPVALLRLAGERRVYGGDELFADDEQWPVQPGERYLVDSLAVAQPRRADALPMIRAVAPPRRVVARE